MAELLASKVVLQEEEPVIRSFPTLQTAVLGIEGITERGPVATATTVSSYEEFERIFGSFIASYQTTLAVRGFFLNGGRQAIVSRTCHFTDVANPATATAAQAYVVLQTGATSPSGASVEGTVGGPWALASGDTMIGDVDEGGNQTATFTAVAAAIECGSSAPFDLADGDTLTVKIDAGAVQTITFLTGEFSNIDAATAAEVAAVINAKITGARATVTSSTKVTITSDIKGTDSHVEVTGGTANAVLSFGTSEVDGTGNVGNIAAVEFSEVKAIIEAAWTNASGVTCTEAAGGKLLITTVATGAAVTLQCVSTSTADDEFGIDNAVHSGGSGAAADTLKVWGKTPGTYAHGLRVKVTAASSGVASEFNLTVLKNSLPLESFPNVTMDTAETRYVETIVNDESSGSWYFTMEDLSAAGTPTQRRPADTSGATPASGSDGLASLDDNDFIGSATGGTGLHSFDATDEVTLFAVPDNVNYTFGKELIEYCRSDKKGIPLAVLDSPAGYTAAQILAYKAYFDGELGANWGALYWPRFTILNPSAAVFGTAQTITVATSGYIAGIMARNDSTESEGPFYQPAGVYAGKPVGVVGLETDEVLLEPKRDLIFPKRINPITYMKGYGIFVDGARTLVLDVNFPSVGERRGVSHIERLLQTGLQWVRHRNHTAELRRDIEKQVNLLLQGWMQRGVFASNNPNLAYFVDVSEGLNPPSVVRSGQVRIRVGLATNTPGEFVIISVTKDTRALEAELAST